MIENDLLKNTSDDIAQFLYKGEGLNKTAIGDYLGERSAWTLSFRRILCRIIRHPSMWMIQASHQQSIVSIPRSRAHPSFPRVRLLVPHLDYLHKKSPVAQKLTSGFDGLTHP